MWSSEYSSAVFPRFCVGELYIIARGCWLTVPLIGGHLPTGRREVVPPGFGQQLTVGGLS
jgi:hypothetical protein